MTRTHERRLMDSLPAALFTLPNAILIGRTPEALELSATSDNARSEDLVVRNGGRPMLLRG